MGEHSDIQWTDATWNWIKGCKKISEGCKFCYAERMANRFGVDFGNVVRTKDATFNMPLRLKVPSKIFTCSISDFFIEEGDQWRDDVWEIIRKTPQHTYQVLTKRPERIAKCLPSDWDNGYPNVWLGVSGENPKRIKQRAELMKAIPAKVKFISIEPLLDSVANVVPNSILSFDWIIVGGESGSWNHYRKCDPAWINGVVNLCKNTDTPVFVKQLGTYQAKLRKMSDMHGGNIEEFPENLQIRQFPKVCE